MLDFLLVFAVACVLGGWAIPVGLVLGLGAGPTYVATVSGTAAMTALVLWAGKSTGPLMERVVPRVDDRLHSGRLGRVVDRWGVPGLAIGSIVIGPTVTLAAVLVLDLPRIRFAVWYAIATLVLYAGLVLFWSLLI